MFQHVHVVLNQLKRISMEVLVGDHRVLLATHKAYRDDKSTGVVGAVASYKPFEKYAASCAAQDPVPSAFIIRHVTRIAQRIVEVIMDVECDACTGKITQTVCLSENAPVVLLPVAVVHGTQYALLIRQRRVSAGCRFTTEAFCGTLDDDGSFTGPNDELLTALGFDMQKLEPLSSKTFTVGNEGIAPYKIYKISMTMDLDTLSAIQSVPQDAATSLVVVRVDEVMAAVDDTKASLAASLIVSAVGSEH